MKKLVNVSNGVLSFTIIVDTERYTGDTYDGKWILGDIGNLENHFICDYLNKDDKARKSLDLVMYQNRPVYVTVIDYNRVEAILRYLNNIDEYQKTIKFPLEDKDILIQLIKGGIEYEW